MKSYVYTANVVVGGVSVAVSILKEADGSAELAEAIERNLSDGLAFALMDGHATARRWTEHRSPIDPVYAVPGRQTVRPAVFDLPPLEFACANLDLEEMVS